MEAVFPEGYVRRTLQHSLFEAWPHRNYLANHAAQCGTTRAFCSPAAHRQPGNSCLSGWLLSHRVNGCGTRTESTSPIMAKQSLFSRIFKIGKANANAALDSLEDPQKMLDQSVRDYTDNIAEAEAAVAQTIGNLRMAEEDHKKAVNEAAQWGNKALAASNKAEEFLAAGDAVNADKFNQLATVAIQRQMTSEKTAAGLAPSIASQREIVEKLKTGLTTMKTKRQELVSKRDELVSRARNAKTQGQMMDAVKALDMSDPTSEISRFETKIRADEAKVRGAAELASSSLDSQFAALEDLGETTEIEARLAALKSTHSNILDEAPAAPAVAAAPELSEIEARLAALKKDSSGA